MQRATWEVSTAPAVMPSCAGAVQQAVTLLIAIIHDLRTSSCPLCVICLFNLFIHLSAAGTIPASLGRLTCLEYLRLSGNSLTGDFSPAVLPPTRKIEKNPLHVQRRQSAWYGLAPMCCGAYRFSPKHPETLETPRNYISRVTSHDESLQQFYAPCPSILRAFLFQCIVSIVVYSAIHYTVVERFALINRRHGRRRFGFPRQVIPWTAGV